MSSPLDRLDIDRKPHGRLSAISVGNRRFNIDLMITLIHCVDDTLVTLLHKIPPQFAGSGQFGLIRVKILMEDDKPFHTGRLRQGRVDPLEDPG